MVDGLVVEGEYSDGYGSYLCVSDADEFLVVCVDANGFSLLYAVVGVLDGSGEDPGVESEE